MVSLVDNDQIPRIGVEEPLPCATTVVSQRVKGCGHHRSGRPEIATHRIRLRDVALEPYVEHVLEAELPLRDEFRRGEDQHSAHAPGCDQRHEDKAAFDRLT
jgi:hypothetical protein